MDLAIGILIGGAFNSIVQSLVKDILTPIISVFLQKTEMANWSLKFEVPSPLKEGDPQLVVLSYGRFLQTAIDFIILALVIFAIVKFVAGLKQKAEDEKNPEIETPKDIALLAEIRDLLKSDKGASKTT